MKRKSIPIALAITMILGGTAYAAPQMRQSTPSNQSAAMQQESANGHFVDVNGAKIYYQESGKGQPLLLIHGYPLNGDLFMKQRQSLSQHYQVITPDLRGFGRSVAPSSDASLSTYAHDMFALMDKLGIKKAVIGGHSMGGMTTLEMYKEHPERFSGMILIDTAAVKAPLPSKDMWQGFAQLGKQSDRDKVMDQLLIPNMLSDHTRMDDKQLVSQVKGMINAASVNGIEGGGHALADRQDNTSVLAGIKVPTLIIVGSQDTITPIPIAEKMHAAIPGSRLAVIEGGSHAAILESAPKADQAIMQWMQQSQQRMASR